MKTFSGILTQLKEILNSSLELQDFSQSKWKKDIVAKLEHRPRTRVKNSEFPVIFITSPSLSDRLNTKQSEKYSRNIFLYAGFIQNNEEKAITELIELEECIVDAIAKADLPAEVLSCEPNDSENSEGYYHPAYFNVIKMEVKVIRRR